ncbi:MAG: hypothetical protein KY475_24555 [Planctomycetes bacterium]|nr:hypothetical protein [Planctomycetota bacterium]
MNGGRWFIAASAALCLFWTSSAFGQASFGPIQPFAGAPTPVYVAAPYAGPELGVTAPGLAPGFFGAATPQVQVPGAVAPSLVGAPAQTTIPYQPINLQQGCGSTTGFRLPLLGNFGGNPGLAQPNTTYMVPMQPGSYYGTYPQ